MLDQQLQKAEDVNFKTAFVKTLRENEALKIQFETVKRVGSQTIQKFEAEKFRGNVETEATIQGWTNLVNKLKVQNDDLTLKLDRLERERGESGEAAKLKASNKLREEVIELAAQNYSLKQEVEQLKASSKTPIDPEVGQQSDEVEAPLQPNEPPEDENKIQYKYKLLK